MIGPVVELHDVSKSFGKGVPVAALSGVGITLLPGERVAVVGKSGSGKSTLLAIAGTLERPSSGSVMIQGQNLARMSDRAVSRLRAQHIGFVFQNFNLLQRLTAQENVTEALMYGRVPSPEREARGRALLEQFGLEARASHLPYQLSGGEQQRVAIARALANEPTLVIADEPTGDLDPESGAVVVEALLSAGANTAVLVATHNPDIAAQCDRQIRLVGGYLDPGSP
ncbi:MAG TPA: ABC transporter ATP-binding protein [Candidatus Dormibacteraeota bacterium]|nr:ABC transporter ATP-binding protein [Candidatus Dormibacteraeota bacterium]